MLISGRNNFPGGESLAEVKLPFPKRFRRRMGILTGSRHMQAFEFLLDNDSTKPEIGITFFLPRKPFEIDITFDNPAPIRIGSIKAFSSGKAEPLFYGVKYELQKQRSRARIAVTPESGIDRLEIEVDEKVKEFGYQVRILTKKEEQADFNLLSKAFIELNAGNYGSAKNLFHEYEEYCPKNPVVSLNLSNIYKILKDYSTAEEYALKAAVSGFMNEGINLYRGIQNEYDGFKPVQEVRSLKEQADGWPPEPHYGVIVLEKSQRFLLGLGDFHVKCCSEIMFIRRPVAARKFAKVDFDFDARKEIVLNSEMRILNREYETDIVPDENLFFNDSSKRNIFITVEEEKECGWILPDLAVGDVVEWNYSLLRRNNPDKSGMYILTDINHPYFPTFKSQVTFETPTDAEFYLSSKDGLLNNPEKFKGDNGKTIYKLSDLKYVPVKNTGFYYENNYLNPVFACSSAKNTWKSISEKIKNDVLGEHFEREMFPKPLKQIASGMKNVEAVLEQSFYWIRDKIKYASLPSGAKQIGKMGRAGEIVEAGMGNCNDKSYLLCLVCKNLNIPFEIVAASFREGIVFKDLPADQFDHVFIRAMPAGRWLYLDASSSFSVFGNPPLYLQGLDALFINDEAHIGSIDEDSPDSNIIEISEVIEYSSGGWIETELNIHSAGFLARSLDENLKSVSLSFYDQNQAAQEALRDYLPSLIVTNCEKTTNTANSNFCDLSCRGKRCPVISLGDRSAANFRWGIPTLPMALWRTFINEELFVFGFPQSVNLNLTFKGEIVNHLNDISKAARFSSDFCDVDEICEKGKDYHRISRSISLKKKYIHSDQMKQFPEIMESIEQALQIVAIFSS
jgi:tetratricopeptide (TPR) repeat protein